MVKQRKDIGALDGSIRDLNARNIGTIIAAGAERCQNTRRGGYFVITDSRGIPLFVMLVGVIRHSRAARTYFKYALEKARRLAQHPDHLSSWQSRDEKKDRWGGAIRVHDMIFSFSGLPEKLDEACMLTVAVMIQMMTREQSIRIARISGNRAARKMLPSPQDIQKAASGRNHGNSDTTISVARLCEMLETEPRFQQTVAGIVGQQLKRL